MKYHLQVLAVLAVLVVTATAQTLPGKPEDSGLTPKSATIYVNSRGNTPPANNNESTESLGVAIANGGNVIVGWEDDDDNINDTEAIWTMFSPTGTSITPALVQTALIDTSLGTVTNNFLSYFRPDGSAVWGGSSWGPKLKASMFGDGVGMGAISYGLGEEIAAFAPWDDQNSGDFPTVQLLDDAGNPLGIVAGVSAEYATSDPGSIRLGDWDYLSTSNLVIAGESRQNHDLVALYGGDTDAKHVIVRIVDPKGVEVRAEQLVSSDPNFVDGGGNNSQMWHGVGVTTNGFAIRFQGAGGATLRLFDTAGNALGTNIDLATLTGQPLAGEGGRGDGAGFHGNGKDAYVHVAGGVDPVDNAQKVWITVLTDTGTVRYSKSVADDLELASVGRCDAAINPDGSVFVVFEAKYDPNNSSLIMGRRLDSTGAPMGASFYISEKELPDPATLAATGPRVAARAGEVAVVWQSNNDPTTINPDTQAPQNVVALRIFSTLPASSLSFTSTKIDDTDVVMSWAGGQAPFLVQGTGALGSAWVNLLTTTNRTARIPRALPMAFFRVQDGTTNNVTLFKSVLNGANERPNTVATPATAIGLLSLNGTTASYWVTYSGLSATATAAHVHGPADINTATGVLFPITPVGAFGTQGVIAGTATITADQAADIVAGQTYFNIHTSVHPGGEIRGQLLPP